MINITKRNLPHWTQENAAYFITFNLHSGVLDKDEQIIIREHIINGNKKFYDLYALIVMPDHVHVILKPDSGYALSRITKGIKGVSANKINKKRNTNGQLWQDESYDRIIRDYNEFKEKLLYMFKNPIKANLTEDTFNYHGWFVNEELL